MKAMFTMFVFSSSYVLYLSLLLSGSKVILAPFCFPAARLLWRVRILWQNTGLTELYLRV